MSEYHTMEEPEGFAVPLDWTSLDVLRAVYRGETRITKRQQQAARDVLPFEHPKFAVVATMNNGRDFAAQLEAARRRIAGAKVIEGRSVRLPAKQDATPVPEATAGAAARGFRRI